MPCRIKRVNNEPDRNRIENPLIRDSIALMRLTVDYRYVRMRQDSEGLTCCAHRMNTQSHALINMALLSRKGKPHRHGCALLGAVLPDLPIFVLFGVETLILGHSQAEIWSERYFLPQWQNFIDPFNSIPLVLIGVGISYLLRSDRIRVVCWSMLLHCLADFFLHREDAHRHFFPLWDYRFKSPISYWEMDYHGGIVSAVEIVAMIGASVYLFPRLQSYFAKGALVAVNTVSALLYIAFILFFG